uniref:Uncharacterized protein n=1 Tax=Medicago truncatula TaxID=3880 RepID=A2Q1F8_MEDTR|nr:hypothetical protein MtrDRAFT_AC148815g38v2 [Medicago truncatula]
MAFQFPCSASGSLFMILVQEGIQFSSSNFLLINETSTSDSGGNPCKISLSCSWDDNGSPVANKESMMTLTLRRNCWIDRLRTSVFLSLLLSCTPLHSFDCESMYESCLIALLMDTLNDLGEDWACN